MKQFLLINLLFSLSFLTLRSQTVPLPYFTSFEEQDTQWTATGDWQVGFPFKNNLFGPFMGNNAFSTVRVGEYTNNSFSELISPEFDLSSVQNPYLSFMLQYRSEACCDILKIQYSENNSTWTDLTTGTINENWSNSFSGVPSNSFYLRVSNSLGAIAQKTSIRFRFLFESNSSVVDDGFIIDNFFLGGRKTTPTNDIAVTTAGITRTSNCGNRIGVVLQNNDDQDIQSNFLFLRYQVDNSTSTEFIGTVNIPARSEIVREIFTNFSNKNVKVWLSNYSSDTDRTNDTTNIFVNHTSLIDLRMTTIVLPSQVIDCRSNILEVKARLRNEYTQDLTNVSIHYQVGTGPIVSEVIDTVFSDCTSGNFQYTFQNKFTFSNEGRFPLKVWTSFANDTIKSNDTIEAQVEYSPAKSLPYSENFDSGEISTPSNNFTSTFPVGWENNNNSSIIIGDRNNPSGPNYSYGGTGKSVLLAGNFFTANELISPCVNIPNSNRDIVLEFFYHIIDDQQNSTTPIQVEVENVLTGSSSTRTVFARNQNSRSKPYKKGSLSLSSFKGDVVRLKFYHTRNLGSASIDLVIDNLKVYESSAEDITITSIDSPLSSGCGSLGDSSITVSIANIGTTDVSSFDICYQINSDSPVCSTVSGGVLQANQTISYTFPSKIDVSAPGNYLIKTYVNHNNDLTKVNDTALSRFDNVTTAIPYRENFDAVLALGSSTNWTVSNFTTDYLWQSNKGNTPSFSTGPSADGSGSFDGVYLFTESFQNAFSGATATIENINCFNLENISNLVFEFDYHMYGASIGKLYLMAFTENGTIALDSIIGQQQTSNTDSWKRRQVSLDTISNSTQTRFAFVAVKGNGDQSDIAIDNITVRDSLTSTTNYSRVLNDISIYPNPANNYITLGYNKANFSNKFVEISVYNIEGQLLEQFNLSNRKTIALEEYNTGVYILEISSQGERIRKKFIVSK